MRHANRLLSMSFALLIVMMGPRFLSAVNQDQPTHRESESIKLKLGGEGRLETFTMNDAGVSDLAGQETKCHGSTA